MQEKYKRLREPLTKDDIELRVGTVGEKGATLLLYKTARVDTKRFDDIFGGRWQRTHYIDNKGNVVCKISIFDEELKEWISREDVGTESNTEKEKGAYSDAFKRAGFAWGVGVELYNSPFIYIVCETVGKGEKNQYGKYKSYELKDRYYFNDAVVSKFEVINDNVVVAISRKGTAIYPNFNNNTQQQTPKEPVKQAVEQQKNLTPKEIDNLVEQLQECGTTAEIESFIEKKLKPNKSRMTIEQQKFLTAKIQGLQLTIKNLNNAQQ